MIMETADIKSMTLEEVSGMLEELGISFGTAVVVLVALYFVVK